MAAMAWGRWPRGRGAGSPSQPPSPPGRGLVLEASGVQPGQIQAYASSGIDLISTSAPITRSSWLDLSMRFEA